MTGRIAIKICGLATPEAAEAAIALGCDYLGLIFYPPSPRHVGMAEAARLAAQALGRIKTVAVTVDAGDDLLNEIAREVKPDFIQLHGHELPEQVRGIRQRFGVPVIKAVALRESDDIAAANRYAGAADILLFDARPPKNGLPGGNGLAFDWQLLQGHEFALPWFLSGGLNAENIGQALRLSGARMVDVSSGVESGPGKKDLGRMQAFVSAIREEK